MAPRVQHDLGTRIQALTLLEAATGVPRITQLTGISKSAIYRLRSTAILRGYDPTQSTKLLLAYVEDVPRSGRPKKATEEVVNLVITTLSQNSSTRQWFCQRVANKVSISIPSGISARTVYRILHQRGYKPTKHT
jgi:transposase